MKYLVSQLVLKRQQREGAINVGAMARFAGLLAGIIVVYSILFHFIMEYEGRSESWITGFYWVLTVMSTLGFGDLTFHSDLGRLFSILVLLSGVVFLLILLPFTFIEFFYEPWMRAQRAARTPTRLPERTADHVILIHYDPVTAALIERLDQYAHTYVLLIADITEAQRLYDLGYKVMLGDLDNPKSYELAQVSKARLVVATATDQVNVNVTATVREISETVQIIATVDALASVDILMLAGASHVLQIGERMGQALARHIFDGRALAHTIGEFGDLLIAEAIVRHTSLVGMTLRESGLREKTGVVVMGLWSRGVFRGTEPDMKIETDSVLVMIGTEADFNRFNSVYGQPESATDAPVIILGGGRVGKATGKALAARGVKYRIVEKQPEHIRNTDQYIFGDAAELDVLENAGIRTTPAVVVTTHDDDMNIYLTIYVRRLREDVQIVSRAGLERNIGTLHRSGADFVMSYASTGANAIMNLIGRNNVLMVDEGLDIFEVDVPEALDGLNVIEAGVRKKTGCTVIATREGKCLDVLVDLTRPLRTGTRMIVVGTPENEQCFLDHYGISE